jgi:hypothetical protein
MDEFTWTPRNPSLSLGWSVLSERGFGWFVSMLAHFTSSSPTLSSPSPLFSSSLLDCFEHETRARNLHAIFSLGVILGPSSTRIDEGQT